MPYFVFQLTKGTNARIRDLTCLDSFENYKDAKLFARNKRAELKVNDPGDIKIMFADHQGLAETKLTEYRDAPILREWEK